MKPILFSGEMVRAILSGRKTQTRRIVKTDTVKHSCQYGSIGDRLWVKETFQTGDFAANEPSGYVYRATDPDWETTPGWKWKPSIFMPKEASRITLEITGITVQMLLEISNDDAIKEGISAWPDGNWKAYGKDAGKYTHPRDSFLSLWESIHGFKSSNLNPLVWVIHFKTHEDYGQ